MKDQVAALCLLRAGCTGGLSASTFKDDVKPLLSIRMSPGELRDAERVARERLISSSLVSKPPRSRGRLALSESGSVEAARLIGIKAWPINDPSWAKLARPALAGLGLGLTMTDYAKLSGVAALRQEILRRLTGREVRGSRLTEPDVRAASAAVGAVRNDRGELERRLAMRGVERLQLAVTDDDIGAFAREVLRIAKQQRTGRVGRDLVFVNHVWKAYCEAHPESQMELSAFKGRLREAWKARKMPLAIANVLDPKMFADVLESRIDDGRQEWHVIDLAAA